MYSETRRYILPLEERGAILYGKRSSVICLSPIFFLLEKIYKRGRHQYHLVYTVLYTSLTTGNCSPLSNPPLKTYIYKIQHITGWWCNNYYRFPCKKWFFFLFRLKSSYYVIISACVHPRGGVTSLWEMLYPATICNWDGSFISRAMCM